MPHDNPTVTFLVSLELPDPEPVAPRLARGLADFKVILLGFFEVPDQTTPEQAREQFEGEAESVLDAAAAEAFEAGATVVKQRLVFTADVLETLERVAAEEGCDAVLIPVPSSD